MNAQTTQGFLLTLKSEGFAFEVAACPDCGERLIRARHPSSGWEGPTRHHSAEVVLDAMEHTLRD